MYGAILGDIAGSRFEFDAPGWTKDFEFLTKEDNWTDDTVMTIAVAEALMNVGKDAGIQEMKAAVIERMQDWGHRYPFAGYGGRFSGWLSSPDPKPYGSFGNGSAMRVSAAGWLYDSLERTREVAGATAAVTHDHPEGLKGAECTAAVIYMGRTGSSKEEIREYADAEFGYDLSETLEEMRSRHRMDETCMDALPKALRSFFDGTSVEDVIRNAVSLGGDTDTIAAIAGAMAEGMYGISESERNDVMRYIEPDMRKVVERFDKITGR
ncbi:MAG: ADP-ribosylglycohydrolase family protein [Lachnospiraceae bacterium]|nr:ADP-ribosylglycohydrolase family protein [Lachnospiraceae bacterium]